MVLVCIDSTVCTILEIECLVQQKYAEISATNLAMLSGRYQNTIWLGIVESMGFQWAESIATVTLFQLLNEIRWIQLKMFGTVSHPSEESLAVQPMD